MKKLTVMLMLVLLPMMGAQAAVKTYKITPPDCVALQAHLENVLKLAGTVDNQIANAIILGPKPMADNRYRALAPLLLTSLRVMTDNTPKQNHEFIRMLRNNCDNGIGNVWHYAD